MDFTYYIILTDRFLAGYDLPILTFTLLYRLMKHRLQGYTGDCCGATFLLCELSFYLGALILLYAHIKYGNPDFINVYLK